MESMTITLPLTFSDTTNDPEENYDQMIVDAIIDTIHNLRERFSPSHNYYDNNVISNNIVTVIDELIYRSPQKKVSREMLNTLGPYKRIKNNDPLITESQSCTICLQNYSPGEYKRILPCSHLYHKRCIDKWLRKNNTDCPICRRNPFLDH